jgi:hypothetical protein
MMQSSGEMRREKVDSCVSAVIARSEATKQSRVVSVALDCSHGECVCQG